MTDNYPATPDFVHGSHGFHHTLDSALAILSGLNVPAARVTVRMAGKGYPTRWVVEQSPKPGSILDPGVRVDLSIAGVGFFHSLPVGMWDSGGETQAGTKEILELLDDPLEKAAHWLREGARLFDVSPDNLPACSRWISLFGLQADAWPRGIWYNLAILLPSLQFLAGKEHGIRFSLNLLLGIPVKEIRRSPEFLRSEGSDLSRLGERYSRLGVDTVVGDRKEDLARLTLILGPVSLTTYYGFEEPRNSALLSSVLDLVTSCYQAHAVSWLVEDPGAAPQLGSARHNAILGINSHLGTAKQTREQETRVEVAAG